LARPAPGDCRSGPRNFERFGGQFDTFANTPSCRSHRTGEVRTALGNEAQRTAAGLLPEAFGLNECEAEHAECPPLNCDHQMRDKLRALCVMRFTGRAADPFDALCSETVIFLPGDRFEFARNMRDQAGHCVAVIIPTRDLSGDLIDLAAWHLDTGRLALWRGRAPMLGGENVLRTRPGLEVPLTVHESVLAWLRADREGVVIIDHRRAADLLDMFTLAVATAAHGEQLRQKLTRPAPPIVIRRAPA
jgi:hypothetical protein